MNQTEEIIKRAFEASRISLIGRIFLGKCLFIYAAIDDDIKGATLPNGILSRHTRTSRQGIKRNVHIHKI